MRKVLFACLVACLFSVMTGIGFAADTVDGTVSDSQCGAKGANASHAGCMQKCLSKGAKAVIVTDKDQKILTIDNPDVVKGHEGHHIAATGTVSGDTIHIDSIKML
jgi:hypothetical protein